jgi:hypothetical protein
MAQVAPFGLSAPAAFNADTEIPDAGDKIELTDGSARTWFLTRLDTNGDAVGLDPATHQNAGVSDFTEGTVEDATEILLVPMDQIKAADAADPLTLTGFDFSGQVADEPVYALVFTLGGSGFASFASVSIDGNAASFVGRAAISENLVPSIEVWKLTGVNLPASGNIVVTGNDPDYYEVVVALYAAPGAASEVLTGVDTGSSTTSLSVNANVAAGDAVIVAAMNANGSVITLSGVDTTEYSADLRSNEWVAVGHADAFAAATPRTMGASWSTSARAFGVSVVISGA